VNEVITGPPCALQPFTQPPSRARKIRFAGKGPPRETPAEARQKSPDERTSPEALEGQHAASDADQPSCDRDFASPVPSAAIPDAARGTMGSQIEFVCVCHAAVSMQFSWAKRRCQPTDGFPYIQGNGCSDFYTRCRIGFIVSGAN